MSGRQLPRLITDEMADGAAMRHWLKDDVEHAALAFLHGRYDRRAALQHVITNALGYAERARMDETAARQVAIAAYRERLAEHELRLEKAFWAAVQAGKKSLAANPEDLHTAGRAVAAVAREAQAPPGFVTKAVRIVLKQR